MATLRSYVERMPTVFGHRHGALTDVVQWANALLDRMSGEGALTPQARAAGAVVRDGVWVDRPPDARDVTGLRNAENPSVTYSFVEENGRIRLQNVSFPEPADTGFTVVNGTAYAVKVGDAAGGLTEDYLKKWLLVVTAGQLAGRTFVVTGNTGANASTGIATVYISDAAPPSNPPTDILGGYLVRPEDYIVTEYTKAYEPVYTVDDDLGFSGYWNLVDAWFRWKAAEDSLVVTDDCSYWRGRVDEEFSRLRAERSNRVNAPQGRRLVGFMGDGAYA
jgi:hypothetical protein